MCINGILLLANASFFLLALPSSLSFSFFPSSSSSLPLGSLCPSAPGAGPSVRSRRKSCAPLALPLFAPPRIHLLYMIYVYIYICFPFLFFFLASWIHLPVGPWRSTFCERSAEVLRAADAPLLEYIFHVEQTLRIPNSRFTRHL